MKQLLLSILMMLLPLLANAEAVEINGIYYNLSTETNTAEVTYAPDDADYYYSGDIVIPETVNYEGISYSVTSIGSGTFFNCYELTSITIPNSVTSIGRYAFENCSSLTSISIPNSVTSIGIGAFEGCLGLTTITIPNSVTTIENFAFRNCSSLTRIKVEDGNPIYDSRNDCNAVIRTADNELIAGCSNTVIPNSVTSIGSSAFFGCSGLTSIIIPNSVTSIGDYAFQRCLGLMSVTIGNSVISIGLGVFFGCSSLTIIKVDDGNPIYDSRNDCNAIIRTADNELIVGCSSTVIPNSVTTIGEGAFSLCSGLTSIIIPNSVTTIEGFAFSGCSSLTSITIPNSVTSIGEDAFASCSSLTSVTIPNSVTTIGEGAFWECSSLTSVTIPNSVTTIGEDAFFLCSGLTSIIIPNSVTSIEYSAFGGCSSLTSITIPNSVTSIGDYAFDGCLGLTTIIIGNSVTSIGYRAFYGCSSLTSVTSLIEEPFAIENTMLENYNNATLYVPAGTKSKYEATDGWKNFTNIVEVDLNSIIDFADATVKAICVEHWDTNGDGMLSYEEAAAVTDLGSAFSDNYNKEMTSFDELKYFTGLTSIADRAFSGCSGLASVTIPESVISIGWYAFHGCSGLASIIIPNSVTTIEGYAFRGCSSLTSITIGSSVTSIGNIVFEDCSNLTFIRVDEGNPVFDSRENCNAIVMTENNELIVGCKNTIIPNSVTSIGESAFESCSSLTSIEIPNSVTSIGVSAFRECIGLTSITIPNSITTIGKHAFFDCSNLTDVSLSEGLISIGEEAFHTCAISTISLPQSLIRIGEQAFQGCRQLTSITLPKNVAYLGNEDYYYNGEMQEEDDLYGDVFNGCDLLADVKVDEQNQAYASVEGLLMTKDMKTLLYIPGAKTEVVVPEGTETIHSGASSSDNLTTITLPKSLKNIEDYALSTEKSILTSIISKNENPTPISNSAFYNITYNNATLYVPIGTKSKYETTEGWKRFKNIVEMGSNSPIDFADATVKAICVKHWDTNGDGMLSYEEAAAVTDLGSAFSYNKEITSFDELKYFTGLKSIGEDAFYACIGITSITIPDSVTSIGNGAFSYCSLLTSISIPNSVMLIGEGAFLRCSSLAYIDIPDGVTSIGINAFSGCSGLTSVTFGNSVTSIGESAFYNCSGLASIFIPNSVNSIGGYAFDGCSNIKTIKVENGNTIYDSRNDCNAIIRTADNELIIGCSNTVIPNSVISIGPFAFAGCSGLTSLIIPNSVTSIGSSAFEDCSSLTSITIPDGVTTIGSYAFKDCSGLTSLTFPNSLTTIEHHAFYGDSVLTSLVIPNSVTTIEECAFLGCSGLTSLTISNNLTSIENAVFFSCRNLISVTIPNSVISIKSSAFAFCSGLTSITIPNSVTSIGWEAFKECSSLASVTIPNSVTSISYHAFYHCSSLTSVIIGNGLMSLDSSFESCNSLSSIQVASDNTYYDSREGCNAIIETSTNKLVFGCKTTVIPNSVTSIGSSAFEDCSGLTSITIPNSVTSIGKWAFIGCSSLTSVTSLIEEPFAIDNYMFENYDNATLYVPVGTKSKYEATDGWKNFKNIVEMDLLPVDNGQTIDFGTDIDENTNLNGNIMDNVFVNVNNGDGSYDPSEGCIIVSKPTDDSAIDGKEIFGEDFKDNYTGVVFKLAPGEGTIKVEAQTTGNMVLKVKIGDGMPITMELEDKLKVAFPYNVSEDTYVYIYGGLNTSNNAKGMRRAEPADGTLKIYGIEVDSKANDIESLEVSQDDIATIYNLNGHRINSLQRGVNIIRMNDGTVRKVVVK